MRIAIVGCGYVADLYLTTMGRHRELELVGVMDRDAARADRFGSHYRVPTYPTLADLLADPHVELVLNLTNPRSHFAVTDACLRAGKHVYSEKPLALTLTDARQLADLADERGLYLSGAPSRVLGEPAQTLWRALRDDAIGQPRLVYAAMDDGLLHTMDFREWKGASGAPWPYRDELEMGCTVEHAGYVLTWLAAFFGPAESVTAYSALLVPDKRLDDVPPDAMAPDFSVACIRFASGLVARLTCSLVAPEDHSIRIFGDTGSLSVDDCWKPRSLVRLERRVVDGRWCYTPDVLELPLLEDPRLPPSSRDGKKVDFCLGPLELVSAITGRRPCRLSSQFGVHIAEVTLAIHQAIGGSARVPIRSRFEPVEPMPWAAGPVPERHRHSSVPTPRPGRVWTMHGVATQVDPRRFAYRNLLERETVRQHLATQSRFVPLPDALQGKGDALTIDDATRAGAEAVLLARECGHAVTLFVNAGQVESGAPYHFLVLNALLDGLHANGCEFDGTSFPTATMADRQTLRRAIKARLGTVTDERARLALVRALGDAWGVHDLAVPPHFETLAKADLVALRDAGVDLQNHGWWHTHHPSLTPAESLREIREGRLWLERELGVQAPYFAVPFGDALPSGVASEGCDVWFSLDESLRPGTHPPNVFNRETLDPRPRSTDQRPRTDPARSPGRWLTRLGRLLRA